MSNELSTNKSLLPWLQKRAVRITIALVGLVIILAVMTVNVAKYESHLATGNQVLLELAPVDPRGFMQGDYMTLRYALEDEVFDKLSKDLPENEYGIANTDGYVVVILDDNKLAKFNRLIATKPDNLAPNEMAIHYRVRNNIMQLATNAFFFQEGQAESFEAAEYGLFRVNDKGEPLLTDMVDSEFKVIKGINIKDEDVVDEGIENNDRQDSGM